MPRGGARKGAGRKPKPLAEKLAAGNPGHRPLRKVEFSGGNGYHPVAPEYLRLMERPIVGIPTPTEIFNYTVEYLEPSECLHLIATALLADYALAKYYLICAQYELSKTATVGYNDKHELVMTDFAEAMLKMQKNVIATWNPIWDTVSRNSEKLMTNPEQDMMMMLFMGRTLRKPAKGVNTDVGFTNTENPVCETESGNV
jgi:hypothetical protein